MSNHGWVIPNANGTKTRCGGPGICAKCQAEQVLVEESTQATMQRFHEMQQLEQDAARYRWLRDHARPTDPHMDGSFVWHIAPVHLNRRARSLEEAVDRAMAEKAQP